jgi:2-methylaconitate cis-trans-isomerase PrpF
MNWVGPVGALTGHLLPTGNATDKIKLENGKEIEVSLIDAGNPLVFVHAEDFGISGSELVDSIDGNQTLIAMVSEVRGKAATMCGLCKDWKQADLETPGLPMLALLAPAEDYKTISGTVAEKAKMDARVRVMFMNKLHESVPGTGSICLAAASRVPDSVVEKVSAHTGADNFLIGHPSGVTPARVKAHQTEKSPYVQFDVLGFSRTARRLMDSTAYYPSDLLDKVDARTTINRQSVTPGVVHEE